MQIFPIRAILDKNRERIDFMIYEKIALSDNDENIYLEVYAPEKLQGFASTAATIRSINCSSRSRVSR